MHAGQRVQQAFTLRSQRQSLGALEPRKSNELKFIELTDVLPIGDVGCSASNKK